MSEELSKRVISAKQKNAVQLLELYGIDIGKLNAIQHETNETMKKIADDYAVVFRKNAEEKASAHMRLATATLPSIIPYIPSWMTCRPPLEEAVNCLSSTSVDPLLTPFMQLRKPSATRTIILDNSELNSMVWEAIAMSYMEKLSASLSLSTRIMRITPSGKVVSISLLISRLTDSHFCRYGAVVAALLHQLHRLGH